MIVDIDLNDIDKAIQTMTKLKELQQKEEKWQPKGGEFHICCGNIYQCGSITSSLETEFGVRFETRESAEKATKAYRKYHRLYKLAEELNEGWNPDMNNDLQPKFVIAKRKGKYISYQINIIEFPHCVYFKDAETAQKAIKILEKEDD